MIEVFRYSSDAWGQRSLAGMSWDLLPYFFYAGVAIIVVHLVAAWLLKRRGHSDQ
ncbi:MAG: hypothetical protein H6978_10320 [Gammaproteobacteria bacterium]|nr:hypothetical protein [Gammaproteobacteria bacterium]